MTFSATIIGVYYPRRPLAGTSSPRSFPPVFAYRGLSRGSGNTPRLRVALVFFSFTQPRRQKLSNSRGVTAQQPFQIQHARPRLMRVPRRRLPPVLYSGVRQTELQHAQQGQTHEQRLGRPLDRLSCPRPALLPTQALLQVAEAILLPETGAEQLHYLGAAQRPGPSHQGEPLAVALDLGGHYLDDPLRAGHTPQTTPFLPTNLPLATVDKHRLLPPRSGPATALTRRRQSAAPHQRPSALPRPAFVGRQVVQAGVVPQARQHVHARRTVGRIDQRPQHVPQGVAAIDDQQMLARHGPRLLPPQFDHLLALGLERHGRTAAAPGVGQLRLAEVEATGHRHEPGWLPRVVEQAAEDDPVVGAHRGGTVGTAGAVLVEGVGPPDVLAGAVDLGVVASPDVVTVPESAGGVLQKLGGDAFDRVAVPGTVLGEGFEGFPVASAFESTQGLGDGVFLGVENESGEPLDKAVEAGSGEALGVRGENVLPERPQLDSVHEAPPGDRARFELPARSLRMVQLSSN